MVGGTATSRNPGQACLTSPASWGANVYFIANGDVLKQFTLDPNTGMLSTTPLHQGTFAYSMAGIPGHDFIQRKLERDYLDL